MAVAALATAPRALADGYTLRVEPTFTLNETDVTDATGVTQRFETRAFQETYRLTLDKTFFPLLRFAGTGSLIDSQVHAESAGIETDSDERQWNATAILSWGNPVLGGALSYLRSDTRGTITGNLVTAPSLGRGNVNETWGAFARWAPLDLPSLEARVARSTDRAIDRDQETLNASLTARYRPVEPLDLQYSLAYADALDDLSGVSNINVVQSGRATYSDELFGRSSVYLAYNVTRNTFETEAPGLGGIVSIQRSPLAGLSLVEPFGAVPESVTLEPNRLLIDGVVVGPPTAPSTGINIGFGPALAGDTALRDVGVQLATDLDPVNTLHVWIDRPLPPAVQTAYAWTVYRSDNNVTWTPVAIVRGVAFGTAENRFEITTEEIGTSQRPARYVKVAVRPLSPTAATDPALQNIEVTELQALFVVPAARVLGRTTALRNAANGTVSTRILSSPRLRHDFSFSVASEDSAQTSWLISNGLSYAQRLTRILGVSARAARSDSRVGQRHVGETVYAGTLSAEPAPTFSSALTLSGTLTQATEGTSTTNGASAFARARLYEGFDANGTVSYRVSTAPDDRTTRSAVASATTSITPHRILTLTAGAGTTRADTSGGGIPDVTRTSSRFDLTAGSSPFPALFLSAGVARILSTGTTPRNLANFAVSWSPLSGGDLTLQLLHSQSIDTATESLARSSQAAVRWRILRNLELNSGYTLADFDSLQAETTSRGFFATLLFTLS